MSDTKRSKNILKLLLVPATEEEVIDSIIISNRLSGHEYPPSLFTSDQSHSDQEDEEHKPGPVPDQSFSSLFTSSVSSPLRILETTINSLDVQVWNLFRATEYKKSHVPLICLMGSCGLIIVSHEPPIDFLERNNSFFSSIDFPILWFFNKNKVSGSQEQKRQLIQREASLSQLNVTKVTYSSPEEAVIGAEFSHWIMKVHSYISGNRVS